MAVATQNTQNDATLDTFFQVLTAPGGGGAHTPADVDTLMQDVFCPDNGATGKNALPCVAITEHGNAQGPGFFGAAEVRRLFMQLFTSFPDVALTQLDPGARLYSPDEYEPITIGVRTDLTGSYQASWFGKVSPGSIQSHYSPPLSDLKPGAAGHYKTVSIPACAVFEFDDDNLVTQLAIYMDRYHFIPSLSLASFEVVNWEIAEVLERLTRTRT
jgi:hypothetical protein